MDTKVINVNNDLDVKVDNKCDTDSDVVKQWRNVNGDLDDFIFYYEDKKYLSER